LYLPAVSSQQKILKNKVFTTAFLLRIDSGLISGLNVSHQDDVAEAVPHSLVSCIIHSDIVIFTTNQSANQKGN
jgi:hypothetical protein